MNRRAALVTVLSGQKSLQQLAAEWQAGGVGCVGGIPSMRWTTNAGVGADLTIVIPHAAFRQSCVLTSIKVGIKTNPGGTFKFKIFRWNAGTSKFDPIAEQAFTVSGTGTKTVTLNPTISVTKGDVPGIYSPAGHQVSYGATGSAFPKWRYENGDITAANALAGEGNNEIYLECDGERPYVVMLGDSMVSYNGGAANYYRTIYDGATPVTLPTGNVAGEIASYFGVTGMLWQSLNKNGGITQYIAQTTDGIIAHMDEAVATNPRYICIHVGTNDITDGRVFANLEAYFNTILGKLQAGQTLIVTDIAPRTAFNDAQSAAARATNTALAAWCAANGVRFVDTYNTLGKLRVSTGLLDDLADAYSFDGTHLSVTGGVQKMADLIKPYLR